MGYLIIVMKKMFSWLGANLLSFITIINLVACQKSEIILFGGSSSVMTLMHILLYGDQLNAPKFQGFNHKYNRKVAYNGTGSSAGENGVKNQTLVMGFTSRDVKSEYIDNSNYRVFNFAIDGMVIIAKAPTNCNVTNISQDKVSVLRDIYTGKSKTWTDLLGNGCANNETIIGVNRESGSGTRDVWRGFLEMGSSDFSSGLRIANSTSVMINQVRDTNNAIGYVSFSNVDSVLANNLVPFTINGVKASIESLTNKSYILYRLFACLFWYESKQRELIGQFIYFMNDDHSGKLAFEKTGLIFDFEWKSEEPEWLIKQTN